MSIAATAIDYRRLFRLRLAIARLGEMDNAGWWNTKGLLSNSGSFVLRRGFPLTHLFVQARTVFTVAAERCRELFDAADCITLWRLPATVEEQFDDHWQEWLEDSDRWQPFFAEISSLRNSDVLASLRTLDLIDEQQVAQIARLDTPSNSPSLQLGSGVVQELTNQHVTLLAAAFAQSTPSKLAVPYLQFSASEVG